MLSLLIKILTDNYLLTCPTRTKKVDKRQKKKKRKQNFAKIGNNLFHVLMETNASSLMEEKSLEINPFMMLAIKPENAATSMKKGIAAMD